MKTLVVMFALLLLAGTGEAGEHEQCYLHGRQVSCDSEWNVRIDPSGKDEIAPIQASCHQRMQEAMRKMETVIQNVGRRDALGTQVTVSNGWLHEHWQPVMRECVSGK